MLCNNLNYKTKWLFQGHQFILKCQILWSISNQKEILIKRRSNIMTWDNWMIRNSYFLYIQHKKSTTFVCTKDTTNNSPILAMTSITQINLNCKNKQRSALFLTARYGVYVSYQADNEEKFRSKMPKELLLCSTHVYSSFTSCSLS